MNKNEYLLSKSINKNAISAFVIQIFNNDYFVKLSTQRNRYHFDNDNLFKRRFLAVANQLRF